MKRNNLLIMILVVVGIIMLFGSSYSLIINEINPGYEFVINNFDKNYLNSYKISVKEKEMEITVSVTNKTINKINYRLDLVNNLNQEENENITYSYELNGNTTYCNLSNNNTIIQNKELDINYSDSYKIRIFTNGDKRISLNLNIQASNHKNKYLANMISETSDNLINADSIRYDGNANNNYVYFNCHNNKCEKWRIMGVFDKKNNNSYNTLPSIKLIKNTPIDKINYNNEDLNGNYDKSYINTYLNGIYYDNLDNQSKNLIINTDWNIGNINGIGLFEEDEISNKYSTKIGLISVSDYLYLKSENWLKLNNSLFLNKMNNNVLIYDNGIKEGNNLKEYNVYPSVYLRGDVSAIKGDGTINNPYVLDVIYPLNYGESD